MVGIKLNRSEILKLISYYKRRECLWNPAHPDYKLTELRSRAWKDIALAFKCSPSDVKTKVKYLRTAYVSEKIRVQKSRTTNNNDVHEPKLFYFSELSYLDNVIMLRKRIPHSEKVYNEHSDNDTIAFSGTINQEAESAEKEEEQELIEEHVDSVEDTDPVEDIEYIENIRHVAEDGQSVEQVFFGEMISLNQEHIPVSSYTTATRQGRKRKIKEEQLNVSARRLYEIADAGHSPAAENPLESDDMFLLFGKSIGLQLQRLPLENASGVMAQIQQLVSEQIVAHCRGRS